ncbi:MAG: fused MFS/spermidine synthase [Gammaproteobacteria bacterium]|nr:fused MFS/spermidine synthase [Gammaproteobacteria bacterium]MCW8910920.1 fused MFS/spermidine synthase [Gammaproteobacteria bacterium]MCW9003858.1 fused MFS/spermidine synthase [Gammaproteobacteria bacterium]MCW9056453.1 fused MFS/spermidine synthase [Gammaproteobacteria bacterium]
MMNRLPLSYLLLIFCSGGIVLSLEVLASRIMSPYFGVSLYIWAGILSITLIGLSLGYYYGGILARHKNTESVIFYFLLFPAITPIAIFFSRFTYPDFFHYLASIDLVVGSFIGCIVLLGVPLVLLSSMNPLLIALDQSQDKGDSGAGKVFGISTIGSVVGVIGTAFILIPNIPNSKGILVLAMLMGLLAMLTTLVSPPVEKRYKYAVIIASLVGISLCTGGLLFQKNNQQGTDWHVVEEFPSFFNTIKVVDYGIGNGFKQRVYMQEAIPQSVIDVDTGESLLGVNYTLLNSAITVHSKAESALVLGVAGGLVPTMLKERGFQVDAVDVNRKSFLVAEKYFNFNPQGINIYIRDARTFADNCTRSYDIIFVDLYHSIAPPDYLMTREFFHSLSQCLNPDGVLAMNTVQSTRDSRPLKLLQSTLLSVFADLVMLRNKPDPKIFEVNMILLASFKKLPDNFTVESVGVPVKMKSIFQKMVSSISRINKKDVINIKPVTDDMNRILSVYREYMMEVRREIVLKTHKSLLLN